MVRRTLDDGLTPEMEEFLKGKPSTPKAKTKPKKQKENPPMRQTALKKDFVSPPPIEALAPIPVQAGMVGLNTRIEPATSAALLRASVERKIQRLSRAAVQDIVNEALSEWMKRNGYLK